MALTYYLKFTRKVEEKKELSDLIKKNKNSFFLISDILSSKFGYVYGDFNNQIIDLELNDASYISIDILKKETDSILLRKYVLQMVHKIANEIYPDEDYYFDFNGDYIFEKRKNGVVKRNSNTDFYNGLD